MKAAHATGDNHVKSSALSVGGVLLQLADTTWRIAVPVLLFTTLGIVADLHFDTKPWLTLPAVVVGFVVAGGLVKRQLDAVAMLENAENKENKK